MARYAVINLNNVIENVIIWDGEAQYNPGNDKTLLDISDLRIGIGWQLVDEEWVAPEDPANPIIEPVLTEVTATVDEPVVTEEPVQAPEVVE